MIKLNIFVSSPSDVGFERGLCGTVFDRLQLEFKGLIRIEPIFWEYQPLTARIHFQPQLPRASDSDLCVILLWWRFGTPLPADVACRPDGSVYLSGTEFEFEDAASGFSAKQAPDIFVYRKTDTPPDTVRRWNEIRPQMELVEAFFAKWFRRGGSFTGAFHEFSKSTEFEGLFEAHVRAWIIKRLEKEGVVDAARLGAAQWKDSPFKGLHAFDVDDALIFCGRTRETATLLDTLNRRWDAGSPFVIVTGASGTGKSSLMRAGLLPLLARPFVVEGVAQWRRAVLTPSNQRAAPLASLAAALLDALPELAAIPLDTATLAAALADAPQQFNNTLALALAAKLGEETRLVIAVDQLEELFTDDAITDQHRAAFLRALAALVASRRVWVVGTVRSDFYPRLVALGPVFSELCPPEAVVELRPPTSSEIADIIRRPAALAGLVFERRKDGEEGLDDVLRDAANASPEALPLLEFALDELYRTAGPERVLTFAGYKTMGGLEGALTRRADEELASLPKAAQDTLPVVLSLLTRFDLESGAITRRRAAYSVLASDPQRKLLVDRFVEARLFVRDRDTTDEVAIGLTHEALLSSWARAVDWAEDNRGFLRWRARLATAEAMWREEENAPRLLIASGPALRQAEEMLAAHREELSGPERAFIEASQQAARRSRSARRTWQAAAALAFVAILGAGAWIYDAYYRPSIAFFQDYERRWGLPEGVWPMAEADTSQRLSSVKLERRGRNGPVVRLTYVGPNGKCSGAGDNDTYDFPMGEDYSPDNESQRICSVTWDYRGDDLVTEKVMDQAGAEVVTIRYETREWTSGPSGRHPLVIDAAATFNGVERSLRSGASVTRFRMNEDGRNISMSYRDSSGEPRPNADGDYGRKREWLTPFPGAVSTKLDRDGNAYTTDKSRITTYRTTYEFLPDGTRVVRTIFLDAKGERTANEAGNTGYAQRIRRYDALGRLVETRYFDVAGQILGEAWAPDVTRPADKQPPPPVAIRQFEWQVERTEAGGTLVQIERTLDARREPVEDGQGGAAVVRRGYDDGGRLVSRQYYARDGSKLDLGDKAYETTWSYDASGDTAQFLTVAASGKPWLTRQGYAGIRYSYVRDANGRVTSKTQHYLDAHLKEGPTLSGASRMTLLYDARGRYLERALRDPAGQLARGSECWALERSVYDVLGRLTERRFLDERAQPTQLVTPNELAGAIIRTEYNSNGNVTMYSHFDGNDRLDIGQRGYARLVRLYDERNRIWQLSYFDAQGHPSRARYSNFATRTTVFGQDGNILSQDFVDGDNRPIDPFEYDAAPNTSNSVLDRKPNCAKPVVNVRGTPSFARTSYRYVDGREVERLEQKASGDSVKRRFNTMGNEAELAYLDRDGRSRNDAQAGYARKVTTADESGRTVRVEYRNTDGAYVVPSSIGFAYLTIDYDSDGSETTRLFDEKGVPRIASANAGGWLVKTVRPIEKNGLRRVVAIFEDGRVGTAFMDSRYTQQVREGLFACMQKDRYPVGCTYRQAVKSTEQTVKYFDVVVSAVREGGPDGLRPGDVVRTIDGRLFGMFDELVYLLRKPAAEGHVLDVDRRGKPVQVKVSQAVADGITLVQQEVPRPTLN